MRKAIFCIAVFLGSLIFSGCGQAPLATEPQATGPTATLLVIPSAVTQSTATQSPAPSATDSANLTAPVIDPTSPPTTGSSSAAGVSPSAYIDNRSDAAALMASFYNAINRNEYLRAYSYWETNSSVAETSFDDYQAGYADTQSVQYTLGQIIEGIAAGNIYYTVPVGLTIQKTDGSTQKYAGCYQLHIANPGVQGTLPFQPLGIQLGKFTLLENGQDLNSQMDSACSDAQFNGGGQPALQPTYSAADISAGRYLDDRSDPVQVLRSLFNAINRSEYVRAYSYWDANAAKEQLPSLDDFAQGYADTQSVQLTTGQVSSEAGAGQIYYTVPVTLVAKTGSATQTFVGCYTLHQSSPQIQATPPFRPLAITDASIRQVDNNADTNSLMATACQ